VLGKAHFYKAFLVLIFIFSGSLFSFGQEAKEGANPAWQKGNPGAKVTIEVFNDYQCPSCAVFDEKLNDVLEKYPNEVLVVFRNFPLIMTHPKAMSAAKAVEAAGIQAKFREMMRLIYRKQDKLHIGERIFVELAEKLDLNVEKFKSDFASQIVSNRIKADAERAKFLKLDSTPSVIFNGRKLDFVEFRELEKIIEKELSK
jgi:protein-disulfide isomerase